MITIEVKDGRFDKAMRKFKDCARRSRIVPIHSESLVFEKPCDKRRRKKQKAIYRSKMRKLE